MFVKKNCPTDRNLQQQDYRIYRFSDREKLLYGFTGFVAGSIFLYFFYRTGYVVIAGIGCMFLFCGWKQRELCKIRKRKLEQQFRDWIEGASHHLETGCSVENALIRAGRELRLVYGEASDICRETRGMEHLLANNIPVEKILSDFGERSQAADICHFADVFAIGKRSGGNLREMIADSCEIIAMRADTEREIHTLLHGKVMEQKVMCLVPFGIMLYISISSPGYFTPLYHNPAGICVMTLCLSAYLFSVWLSLFIIRIEV